jgi:hypothetical protein
LNRAGLSVSLDRFDGSVSSVSSHRSVSQSIDDHQQAPIRSLKHSRSIAANLFALFDSTHCPDFKRVTKQGPG